MPYVSRPPGQVGFSRGRYGQAPVAAQMQPQRVYKLTLPDNPEQASMISLDYIHALVRDGREDPIVRRKAFQILREYGVRERDYSGTIRAIHNWIQRHVRYEHDPAGVEFLTQARVLIDQVERGEAFEDCDSFVLLEHALLNSVGVPTRSVIIAADRRDPSQWSHIFLQAFDNRLKQWVTLDPIMKDKPVGWHPPKFFRKRVVPIADGAPFPPRPQLGQPPQLPAGMTVEFLPTQPSRTSAAQFYAGAVGGWHGFGHYGVEFTERPPSCPWPGDPNHTGPGPGAWDHWAKRAAIIVLQAHPDVRPQGMDAAAWVGHMEGVLRSQLGPQGLVGTQYEGKDPDFLFARVRLEDLRHWLGTHGYPEIADELHGVLSHLEACEQQYGQWQTWYQANIGPKKLIQTMLGEIRELGQIRSEALSYVVPILDSLTPLLPLAEHHMGRIKERQAFLAKVGEIAKWTSRALSAIGPLTGGITEILAIAIELGNMGYQLRQASQLATGSAATVLGNIADAFDRGDALVRASQEVAERANTKAQAIQEIVDTTLRTHPEWAPTPAEEAAMFAAAAPASKLLKIAVAAAAALALWAVVV